MGAKAAEIVGVDLNNLITSLRKAYCDEWLAYYQYWVGAKVIKGPTKSAAIKEILEHAGDELRHAEMLTKRIIQLGGSPVLKPEDWYKFAVCGYASPEDPFVRSILKQNLAAERCAIGVYDNLIKEVKDKDAATADMLIEILEDELEHEEDLEGLLSDLEELMKR